MAIKLKNMNEKHMGVLLCVFWILLLTYFCMALSLYVAGRTYPNTKYLLVKWYTAYTSGGTIYIDEDDVIEKGNTDVLVHPYTTLSIWLIVAGVFITAVLGNFTYKYLKKHDVFTAKKSYFFDSWYPEIEILVFAACLVAVLCSIFSRPLNDYLFSYHVEKGYLRMLFLFLFLNIGLFLAAFFLMRKKRRKEFLKTSLISKIRRWYRNECLKRSDLEKTIVRSDRWYIYTAAGLAAFSILMLIFGSVFLKYRGMFHIIAGISLVLLLIFHFIFFLQNHTLRDVGFLLSEIHAMSHDLPDTEGEKIPEDSLLYNAAQELAQIQDTIQRSVEKQVQAEHMKVELITNVSHDLKTPLTSMIGYTDLMKKEDLTPKMKEYVDTISQKQEQLSTMIKDIFELSKAASNSEQLNMQVLNMNTLVEQIMTDMEDVISEKDFGYVKRLHPEPLYFMGDDTKMYRVVQNLLENTLKYTLSNTRVFVETSKKDGNVLLTVKNISSYEMDFSPDEIVERFVRGDKARTTEGHGIGLAIVSNLLRNMNGNFYIETEGDMFKAVVSVPETEKE